MRKKELVTEIEHCGVNIKLNEEILEELKNISVDSVVNINILYGPDVQKTRGPITEYVGRKNVTVSFQDGKGSEKVIDYLTRLTVARIERGYEQLDLLAEELKNAPR